jgi:hypothetical protein
MKATYLMHPPQAREVQLCCPILGRELGGLDARVNVLTTACLGKGWRKEDLACRFRARKQFVNNPACQAIFLMVS